MENLPSSSTHHSPGTEQQQFPCLECGKVFAQKRSLLRHDQAKHWKTQYHCSCLKTFSRRDHLRRHEKFCNGQIKIGTITDSYPVPSPPELDRKGLPTTKDFIFKSGSSLLMKNSVNNLTKITPWKPYQKSDSPHKASVFKTCPVTDRLIIPDLPRIEYIPVSTPPTKIDKKEDIDIPTRATSSPIPGTSHEVMEGDLLASLFGEIDSDTEQVDKPTQSASMILLSEDLNLSSSSISSLELSLEDFSPSGENTLMPQEGSKTDEPPLIQATLLKVVDDLMDIQKLTLLDNPPDMSFFNDKLFQFYNTIHSTVKATSDKYI